ncbi:MAG: choloylglycine hydrolase family protein [Eubacterium sp.]|nr:choloylglycine hydrolase family protein [Eubacterium sp.]
MCTAATYLTKNHYFGRNLDLEFSYHETVTITPRRKPFAFRHMGTIGQHQAMIGMAFVVGDYPLYYDATNEHGLSMAGLNFPGNAVYNPVAEGKDNVASFELIPWVLSQCATVDDARRLLGRINVTDDAFRPELPPSTLHWMIADRKEAIVFEQTCSGAKTYADPVGVMTNNPTFDYHILHLQDYMNCSAGLPENRFTPESGHQSVLGSAAHDEPDQQAEAGAVPASAWMNPYSRGMGGMGIPGDLSSASRFVKAAFTRMNSVSGDDEASSVSQFFKILGSVEQQKGCCRLDTGAKKSAGARSASTESMQSSEGMQNAAGKQSMPTCEYTIYSSCCNTDKGIYYYTTYENSRITGVDMHKEDLDGERVITYELRKNQDILLEK